MVNCKDCRFCSNSCGRVYIICTFFNQVIDTSVRNGCPSFRSRGKKFGLKRDL